MHASKSCDWRMRLHACELAIIGDPLQSQLYGPAKMILILSPHLAFHVYTDGDFTTVLLGNSSDAMEYGVSLDRRIMCVVRSSGQGTQLLKDALYRAWQSQLMTIQPGGVCVLCFAHRFGRPIHFDTQLCG